MQGGMQVNLLMSLIGDHKLSKRLLKAYVFEVLTGFKTLSAVGPDRALGNLRMGDHTLSQKNRSIFDDLEDEEDKDRKSKQDA